jgi:hypothetical protein
MWRQKQSINNFGFQDARLDAINNIFNLIVSNKINFIGFPIEKYLQIYHFYPHNTFLDIILNNGFVFGFILILFIFFKFIFLIQSFFNKKYIFKYWIIQILIVSFLSYLFLSMYHEKIFWFTLSLLFYFSDYNKKNYLNYV